MDSFIRVRGTHVFLYELSNEDRRSQNLFCTGVIPDWLDSALPLIFELLINIFRFILSAFKIRDTSGVSL